MTVIHSMSGSGTLVVGENRVDGVVYRIDVSRVGTRHLRADGPLSAPPMSVSEVIAAFTAGYAQLELQTGGEVQIVPTQMDITERPPGFSFAVSGPVPGFGE